MSVRSAPVRALVFLIQLYRHHHPDHAVLTTDVETAFQSAPRSQMERELYADADLRPLLPYFYALYADEASLSVTTCC